MMTNGDPERQIFLFPHTNNGFFFLLTTVYCSLYLFINVFIYFKISFQYTKMQFHMMTLLDVLGKIACVRL